MNTNSLFYILLFLFLGNEISAQISRDTILYEYQKYMRFPNYVIYDNTYYKWQGSEKQTKYTIYKDTIPLASTIENTFRMNSYYVENISKKLYIGHSYGYFMLDMKIDTLVMSISPYEYVTNFVVSNNKLYFSTYQTLYIQNLTDGEIIDSINVNKIITKPYYGISQIIKFPSTSKVLLMIAYQYYGDEISDEQYYVYDLISKKVEMCKNNELIKNNINPMAFNVDYYDINLEYVFIQNFILDKEFNIFSKINEFCFTNIYGFVFSNNEIKQLIVYSILDSKDNKKDNIGVLIPFTPDPFKEKAMYGIYENKELTISDLEQFDAFDLRLLRNMVFAKHNYAFKDKFLQAYFNLYSFYRRNYNNRLTDVNDLLTLEDKKNLELIQKISKMKEEN
jgi:hypothetical protein